MKLKEFKKFPIGCWISMILILGIIITIIVIIIVNIGLLDSLALIGLAIVSGGIAYITRPNRYR